MPVQSSGAPAPAVHRWHAPGATRPTPAPTTPTQHRTPHTTPIRYCPEGESTHTTQPFTEVPTHRSTPHPPREHTALPMPYRWARRPPKGTNSASNGAQWRKVVHRGETVQNTTFIGAHSAPTMAFLALHKLYNQSKHFLHHDPLQLPPFPPRDRGDPLLSPRLSRRGRRGLQQASPGVHRYSYGARQAAKQCPCQLSQEPLDPSGVSSAIRGY